MIDVSLADLFEGLGKVSMQFDLPDNVRRGQDGQARAFRSAYGSRFWRGSVTVQQYPHADSDAIVANMRYLQEADVRFEVAPKMTSTPAVSSDAIDEISATDRRNLRLATEVVPRGRYFVVTDQFGNRSLHHVRQSTADRWHTVTPALREGTLPGDGVEIASPAIWAVIDEFTAPPLVAVLSERFSFSWIEAP